MAIVARGQLADHSAPRVVATLTSRGFTGELVIESAGRAYHIAWADGSIVGAQSPHPADSAAKIALTLGVLSSTQAGEVARIVSANPGVDELEVIAQAARLPSELLERLARRLAASRSARALAVESGTYTVSDELPYWGSVSPVDARWVLYHGIRQHFTIDRAERELRARASVVRLRAEHDFEGFGFGEAEEPILDRLRADELPVVPMPVELDRQLAHAVILALLLLGEVEIARPPESAPEAPPRARSATMPPPRSATVPQAARVPTPPAPAIPAAGSASPAASPARAAHPHTLPTRAPPATGPSSISAGPATLSTTRAPLRARRATNAPQAAKIQEVIAERLAILDAGANHFTLLGVPETVSAEELRGKYFALARHLHPDRLKAADVEDHKKDAQRLFARINEAFATLSDPAQRARYIEILRAGGEAALRANEEATEAAVRTALDAEERFRLGEMALRHQQIDVALREFQKAVELNPGEADHHAMLAWAIYIAASDKVGAMVLARGHLHQATKINQDCVTAFLIGGRIARMEGNDTDALKYFQKVLTIAPTHQEAAIEIRAIESRAKAARKRTSTLFGVTLKKS